jgi:hypothetical protein
MSRQYRLVHFGALIIAFVFLFQISLGSSENQGSFKAKSLKNRAVPDKPANVIISSEANVSKVVVKFREGSDVRFRQNKLNAKAGQSVVEAESILAPYFGSEFKRFFSKSEMELDKAKFAYELSSGQQLADMNLYYKIDVKDAKAAERLINQLNRLDIVELAYIEPVPEPAGDIDPPTPDYNVGQSYLRPAPAGVDADYAKTLTGGDGAGVKIVDIEFGWNETHEDLEKALGAIIVGGGGADDHGTAVLGEMIAGDNGYGVTGICPGADVGMVSVATLSTSEAILTAVDNLERGDLILIELHAPGPHYNFQTRPDQLGYVCMEYWQDIFDVIQYAWSKGIIVCEAAGNGAENFDYEPYYGQLFDTTFRNSHAIICGAGAPPSGVYGTDRSRLSFSNYGERVNLQGFGRGVYTTGYGSLFDGGGDINQYYTATFSGTSSASPIVTGSVACLQGYYMATYAVPLDADIARSILVATGSVQQGDTSQHIGPRPNLAAAIPAIVAPPSLYAEPMNIDTTLQYGQTANINVWLHNRSNSYGVDFSIIGNDSLPKLPRPNWLEASPAEGTIATSDSFQITVILDATSLTPILKDYKGAVEISWGVAGGALDSMTYLPVFLMIPCQADTVFTALSSDTTGGPVYNWIEINNSGTLIPKTSYYNTYNPSAPLDDGSAGPFALPFSFPFYGSSYDQYYIGINGAISFTDSDINSGGYYAGFNIPGNPFATFISAFWNDFIIDSSRFGHGDIYYYNSPTNDTTIIEWYQVGNFNSENDTLTTFEIILTIQGDIKCQYLAIGETGLENTALIGINAELCSATSYFDFGNPLWHTVSAGGAVLFDQHLMIMAGDCNNSGLINIQDVTYLINYLYKSGAEPIPLASGDVNCSTKINIQDVTYLINYLYKGGAAPCYFIW